MAPGKAQNVLAQGRSREVWQDIRAVRECWAVIQTVLYSTIKKKDGKSVFVGSDEILSR